MKTFLAVAACIFFQVALAVAQPAADPFSICATMTDDHARVACYDSVHRQQLRSPSAAPGAVAPMQPMTSQSPANALPPSAARRIVSAVASYSLNKDGKFTVVLENGQVWRQHLDDDARAEFKPRGRNIVVITRGFWNSYDMKLNDMHATFSVQRVQPGARVKGLF